MPLDETFTNLAAFLNSLDSEGEQKFELSHSLVIICPDCGKNIAFRGRCPKCAGNSWIPAGHTGGIFERTKAQRLRRMIADEDDTLTQEQGRAIAAKTKAAAIPPQADDTNYNNRNSWVVYFFFCQPFLTKFCHCLKLPESVERQFMNRC